MAWLPVRMRKWPWLRHGLRRENTPVFDLDISRIIISLPAIMIGLTFHEYAHGRMADYLGDDTPYYQGRLTLNPLPHIDWIGFFMLMIAGFGWAKPVQVNPY